MNNNNSLFSVYFLAQFSFLLFFFIVCDGKNLFRIFNASSSRWWHGSWVWHGWKSQNRINLPSKRIKHTVINTSAQHPARKSLFSLLLSHRTPPPLCSLFFWRTAQHILSDDENILFFCSCMIKASGDDAKEITVKASENLMFMLRIFNGFHCSFVSSPSLPFFVFFHQWC